MIFAKSPTDVKKATDTPEETAVYNRDEVQVTVCDAGDLPWMLEVSAWNAEMQILTKG